MDQAHLNLIYTEKLMPKVLLGRMEFMLVVLILRVELESIQSLRTQNTGSVVSPAHTSWVLAELTIPVLPKVTAPILDAVVVGQPKMMVNVEMTKEEDMAPKMKTEPTESASAILINSEVLPEMSVDIKILTLELTASYWVETTEEVATVLKNFKRKMLAF
jgi:hypothetical protein